MDHWERKEGRNLVKPCGQEMKLCRKEIEREKALQVNMQTAIWDKRGKKFSEPHAKLKYVFCLDSITINLANSETETASERETSLSLIFRSTILQKALSSSANEIKAPQLIPARLQIQLGWKFEVPFTHTRTQLCWTVTSGSGMSVKGTRAEKIHLQRD